MRSILQQIWNERIAVVAVILFAVGFATLLLHRNLLKKIIGLNIMDTAGYLLLTSLGYIENRLSPIIQNAETDPSLYVNPLPISREVCESSSGRAGTNGNCSIRFCDGCYARTDHSFVCALSQPERG